MARYIANMAPTKSCYQPTHVYLAFSKARVLLVYTITTHVVDRVYGFAPRKPVIRLLRCILSEDNRQLVLLTRYLADCHR